MSWAPRGGCDTWLHTPPACTTCAVHPTRGRLQDRSAANGGAAAASAAGGADRTELVLLEGQCAALSLTLENVGKLDIDHVTVDVASSSNVLAKYARDRHPLVHFTGALPRRHPTVALKCSCAAPHAGDDTCGSFRVMWRIYAVARGQSRAGARRCLCFRRHERDCAAARRIRALLWRSGRGHAVHSDCAPPHHCRQLPAQGGRQHLRWRGPCGHNHRELLVRARAADAPRDQGAAGPRHAGHWAPGRAHDWRARAPQPARGVCACGTLRAARWRGGGGAG